MPVYPGARISILAFQRLLAYTHSSPSEPFHFLFRAWTVAHSENTLMWSQKNLFARCTANCCRSDSSAACWGFGPKSRPAVNWPHTWSGFRRGRAFFGPNPRFSYASVVFAFCMRIICPLVPVHEVNVPAGRPPPRLDLGVGGGRQRRSRRRLPGV